ncbi:MAG TPA: HemK2/MTQ2 family protein methyltransferase [Patescibacteria group bacterium]|nr:HemK2/MTQ2 family protein methyltransferase [Patescibacteria group bacterium]
MSEIYSPAEDSFFLSEIIEKEVMKLSDKKSGIKILEIGCGSGVQLKTLNKSGIKKENIFSCDINLQAVKHCKSLGFNSIKSNLFEKIKGKFDLIIFNPPYLPESKYDKEKDTTGGKRGDETIVKFLKQLKNHLTDNGKAFLLLSSHTPMNNINKEFKKYKTKLLGKKKLFFEELYVWELKK